MIPIAPMEDDDPEFLGLVRQILNGAVEALHISEIYLVQVDNWFDHKWLGWRSRWDHGNPEKLRVPLFTPNRVCSELRFVRDGELADWESLGMPAPLHVYQAGRSSLAKPLDRFSKFAAFVWYTGNTLKNGRGSMMFYASGADGYAWYASLTKDKIWQITDDFRTTRRELQSFAEIGKRIELAELGTF